jgi:hypothetical protein
MQLLLSFVEGSPPVNAAWPYHIAAYENADAIKCLIDAIISAKAHLHLVQRAAR